MPVLAFANLKGGVAKTSNAVAVAEALAHRGYKVLVIDADHQCSSSAVLLGLDRLLKVDTQGHTLHDLLRSMIYPTFDESSFDWFVVRGVGNVKSVGDRLSVLPCSVRIDDFESNVKRARRDLADGEFSRRWQQRRRQMRRWLNAAFDYTIIDCPPSLALQVRFLVRISNGIIVPSIPDTLSVRGAKHFIERLEKRGIVTPPVGTLWTLYREQSRRHRNTVEMYKRRGALPIPRPFRTVIPNATALAEASDTERTFSTLRQKYTSEFAALYEALCDEILGRLQSPDDANDPMQGHLHALVPATRRR